MPRLNKSKASETLGGIEYTMRSMSLAATELWLEHAETLAHVFRLIDTQDGGAIASRHENVTRPDGASVQTNEILPEDSETFRIRTMRKDSIISDLVKALQTKALHRTMVALLIDGCLELQEDDCFDSNGNVKPDAITKLIKGSDWEFFLAISRLWMKVNFKIKDEQVDEVVRKGKAVLRLHNPTETDSGEASDETDPDSSVSGTGGLTSNAAPSPISPISAEMPTPTNPISGSSSAQ